MPVLAAPHSAVGVPTNFTAISISAAVVALVLALLLQWRPLNRLNFIVPWLCLIAGIGFAAAFLRSWAHSIAGFGRAVPYVGVALAVAVAVVLLFIVLYDLWPGHPTNRTTAIASTLLPSMAPEIGGFVGASLGSALSWLAVAGATVISTSLGV